MGKLSFAWWELVASLMICLNLLISGLWGDSTEDKCGVNSIGPDSVAAMYPGHISHSVTEESLVPTCMTNTLGPQTSESSIFLHVDIGQGRSWKYKAQA